VRLRSRLRTPEPELRAESTRQLSRRELPRKPVPRRAPFEQADVFFHNKKLTTPVFERGDLTPELSVRGRSMAGRPMVGRSMRGPAVITEYSATTVIPPGKKFWVDEAENLVIKI
jgi:N-methylhydantoinase A